MCRTTRPEARFQASATFYATFLRTLHNAEDFKQGATSAEPALSTDLTAPCLKFRCAKPLQTASTYVFWKVAVPA